jgi:uncharacterized membrane protein YcfT
MLDLFLISSLFLARVIDRDWRTYLDRKAVHLAYFRLLWTGAADHLGAPVHYWLVRGKAVRFPVLTGYRLGPGPRRLLRAP